MDIYMAPGIKEDSWLNRGDEEFEEFKKGYAYASTQTMAIYGLAKVTPEELYYIWSAMKRGIEREASNEHSRQTQSTEGLSGAQEGQQAASETGEKANPQGHT